MGATDESYQPHQQVLHPNNHDSDEMQISPHRRGEGPVVMPTAPVYPGPALLLPTQTAPARIPQPQTVLPANFAVPTLFPSLPVYPSPVLPMPAAAALGSLNTAMSIPRPIFTVQDQPNIAPLFNGVNPNYPGLTLLNSHPPIFAVEGFLTDYECEFLKNAACDSFTPAPVVGRGNGEVSPSRTSTTCYLAREDLPTYMSKVSMLTGKPVEHCELPQVGRYLPTQQYMQHFDAFDLSNEDGRRFASNGGQRVVTVLSYLNDVSQGGCTSFPALNLKVQPKKGMCIVFFPASLDGLLDKLALHAAEPAVDVKYVSQVWIRQGVYSGQASKRLPIML